MQKPPVRLSLAPGTTAHQLMAQGMPETRLPRPQARLVLPELQPALLPAARRRRGFAQLETPERFVRAYVLRTLVGHGPQPGARRGPDPGRAAACWTERHAPHIQHFPRYYAAMPRAHHAALQAAPTRAGAAGAAPGQGGTPCCASLDIPTAVSGPSTRTASSYVSPSTKTRWQSCDACNR